MEKIGDLFKKIGAIKGTFHSRMDMIKNKNGKDLTEAEDIKKRCQEYTRKTHSVLNSTAICWEIHVINMSIYLYPLGVVSCAVCNLHHRMWQSWLNSSIPSLTCVQYPNVLSSPASQPASLSVDSHVSNFTAYNQQNKLCNLQIPPSPSPSSNILSSF